MRKLTATLCLTIAVLLFITIGGESDDFQKRMDAVKKEEGAISLYGPAQRRWKSLAENGDAFAQYNMGLMYAKGDGVIKDNVYAHMWGNIAASNGNENGGKLRDLIAKLMTATQIEKAQDLARECIRKKYKGC